MFCVSVARTPHRTRQQTKLLLLVEIVIIWLNTNFQKQQLGSLNINGDRYRQFYQLFNLQMILKTKIKKPPRNDGQKENTTDKIRKSVEVLQKIQIHFWNVSGVALIEMREYTICRHFLTRWYIGIIYIAY